MLAKFLAILNPAMLIRIGALALPVFALAACSGGEPTLSYGFYAYFASGELQRRRRPQRRRIQYAAGVRGPIC